MKKNSLWKSGEQIYRILEVKEDTVFVIDCVKRTMPKWIGKDKFSDCIECIEKELILDTGVEIPDEETMDAEDRRFIREHFTMIAPILPFVSDIKQRTYIINQIAIEKNVSKQTIRNYLCLYLVYQNEAVFCPKQKEEKELTEDEKNMRWGLNKFYYNHNKNSLSTAYTMMLQAKYCDESGKVLSEHPSINQFRYFEKKYRKRQNYYISRNGLKDYQKNHRPLLGDGIQEFASHVGVGMLDATVCDIYLEGTPYCSLRGEQRNIGKLHEDFTEYYKELSSNYFTELWQIQKVFTNDRMNFNEICMIGMLNHGWMIYSMTLS